jgi:hypothetical protein
MLIVNQFTPILHEGFTSIVHLFKCTIRDPWQRQVPICQGKPLMWVPKSLDNWVNMLLFLLDVLIHSSINLCYSSTYNHERENISTIQNKVLSFHDFHNTLDFKTF